MLSIIKKWIKKSEKYFFSYHNGFFELPFLANGPETMIATFENMPFNTHDKTQRKLITDNIFVKGFFFYDKIEDGLYVLYSEMEYKKNVLFKPIYDETEEEQYNFISYNIYSKDVPIPNYQMTNNVKMTNKNWSFFKSKAGRADAHHSGTEVKYITVYFNKNWYERNLKSSVTYLKNLSAIMESEKEGFFFYDLKPNQTLFFDEMSNVWKTDRQNIFKIKTFVYDIFKEFLQYYKENPETQTDLPKKDRLRILNIEKYLTDHLTDKFPGIDYLSSTYKISPTKLKADFKVMYNMPIFSYFQEKQMVLAKDILLKKDIQIKEVADLFGYENAGKFSRSFKKHHQILPSEIMR